MYIIYITLQVNWLPFSQSPGDDIPRTRYFGLIQYRDIVELYDPLRVIRQLGFVQMIPRAVLHTPEVVYRGSRAERYMVDFSIQMAREMWRAFPSHQILSLEGKRRVRPGRPTTGGGYIQWFRRYSHPYIAPGHDEDETMEHIPLKSHSGYVSKIKLLVIYYVIKFKCGLLFLSLIMRNILLNSG